MTKGYIKHTTVVPLGLLTTVFLSGLVLSSSIVSADNDSVVDEINITVPVSCTMTGTGMQSHNAEIANGTYTPDIGSTTLHAFCNDNEGFAIYAAGYTGNEIGGTNSNKLVGTNASSNATIVSGIATTAGNPDLSNWAMKLAISQDSGDTTSTNAFTIDSAPNVDLPSQAEQSAASASFSQYHVVPNEYTEVAHKNSATDMTTTIGGVKLTTTYAAYISKTQPADTYSGQVIYTLVHPSNHEAPIANPAVLDTGKVVNSKLKSLAATVVNGEETTITPEFDPNSDNDWYYACDEFIKSISVHTNTPAPDGFIPSEKNTISSSISNKPIYIIFDNTNDAGIMHIYTEEKRIALPSDSSFMFYHLAALTGASDLLNWSASGVTDMHAMFYGAGNNAPSFSLNLSSWDTSDVTDMYRMFYNDQQASSTYSLNLSSWDTSSVTNMAEMFSGAGERATTWSIEGLSSWNTTNVMDMSSMFFNAGHSATTFNLNLSSWNTSNVTDMSYMFYSAGYFATTFTLNLSSWNTSNVTDMSCMFASAGNSATTWSIGDLSSWNTSSVTNMGDMFSHAGYSATTFTLDLSSWNTSNVTDMYGMFSNAGYSATTWSIGDISSWNTSNVTSMSRMFYYAGYSATTFTLNLSSWNTSNVTYMISMFSNAGYSATTWSVIIPQTNGNSINNTTSRLYGQTTSTYVAPPSGKSFTIAQP